MPNLYNSSSEKCTRQDCLLHVARNSNRPVDKADLDIWYNPTYENYFNLLNALEAVPLDVERLKAEQDPNPKKSFLKFDLADCTLDLNPSIRAAI